MSINDYVGNLHDYGIDPRARRVFMPDAVGVAGDGDDRPRIGADTVVRNLLLLDRTPGQVELWLSTPGGDVLEMWAVVDTMATMRNPVLTVALGNVASAGCLILASGTGTRYAMPHASMMWHAGTTGVGTGMTWPDARARGRWEEREAERWVDAMARRTKPRDNAGKLIKTLDGRKSFWARYVEHGGEMWLNAADLIHHGVVDEMWTRE